MKQHFHPDGDFGGFADPLQQRQFLAARGWQGHTLKGLIRQQRRMLGF